MRDNREQSKEDSMKIIVGFTFFIVGLLVITKLITIIN